MPRCNICGEEFRAITETHLKKAHGIDGEEYRKEYPDKEDVVMAKAYHYANEAEGKRTITMRDLADIAGISKSSLHKKIRPLLDKLEGGKEVKAADPDEEHDEGNEDEEDTEEDEPEPPVGGEVEVKPGKENEKDKTGSRKIEPIDVGIAISIIMAVALLAGLIL